MSERRIDDAGVAGGLRGAIDLGGQFGDTADGAQPMQPVAVDQRQTSGIVSAVFQFAQSFEENRDDIAVSDRGDDATHD